MLYFHMSCSLNFGLVICHSDAIYSHNVQYEHKFFEDHLSQFLSAVGQLLFYTSDLTFFHEAVKMIPSTILLNT